MTSMPSIAATGPQTSAGTTLIPRFAATTRNAASKFETTTR